MAILKKLFDLQKEINRIKKDSQNPHFKNTYADINAIYDEVKPLLDKAEILQVPNSRVTEHGRNIIGLSLVCMEDNSNQSCELITQEGLTAQQTFGATTYFRRLLLVNMLGLQTVDDDGQVGSNPINEKTGATEEQVLEIEGLMNGDSEFRTQWLNFIGVKSFDKASKAQLEKAITQLKKG